MRISGWDRHDGRRRRRGVAVAVLALLVVLTGCAQASAGSGGRVSFAEPVDGASVESPVAIKMAAENFTVEPAGEVRAGRGHLHVMIDAGCVAPGEVIPKDDAHVHYGQGQTEATLDLPAGTHRLCMQAADGAHRALPGDGMKQEITITVK